MMASVAGSARELRVGIGFALPPYVIRDTDSGLEVDIIREALANAGHTAQFVYLPNLRMPVEFVQGNVDCVVANVAYDLESDSGRKGYPSHPTVAYQNYAISLEGCECAVDSIAELATMSVLGFNNAVKYLGPEFADMVRRNPDYAELADQALQVRMLFSGRVQVVISDKRIFQWWRRQLVGQRVGKTLDFYSRVVYSPVFPPAWRHVTFAREEDRDDFNRGLDELRRSGRFDAIVNEYVGAADEGNMQ